MGFYRRVVDRSADWVTTWLRSRAAFVQVFLGTVLWVPAFVLTGVDPKGTLYLDIATALSLVTQVPLAMIGWKAMIKAEAAEKKTDDTLGAMLATMKAVQALVEAVRHELQEQDEILTEIHDGLTDDSEKNSP